MRLQRVDTNTKELLLGEGKIIGDHIIFNMTPSPGASVCLYNGTRDAEQIMAFFEGKFHFDKEKALADLRPEGTDITGKDVSLKESYSS
jgi:malate dehydrogenase (quinone)